MDAALNDRYDAVLDWLYHVEVSRGWDLKLESVRHALARLGSPEEDFPALHIAGTNGKGSTAAMAQAVLSAGGLRVGLYTSPHLSDFRERIRIGPERIARDAVVALVDEVRERIRGSGVELTFFELTTVIALLHFARGRVDAAVIEVGLGGRLDATNVVHPRATAVTTIALDHERWLGSTLEEIAAEKAGIFKRGLPAVIGRVAPSPLRVLERTAESVGSPVVRIGREFEATPAADGFEYRGTSRTFRGLRCALAGRFQIDNAAVALAALEAGGWLASVPEDAVRRGLGTVEWPGRLEILAERPLVILDGAHNPAGIAALAAELPGLARGRPVHLVFGVLADKCWQAMLEQLAPLVADVIVVPVRERRSEDPGRVAATFAERVPSRVAPSGSEAVENLVKAASKDDVVLVAGSLFLVGEVRAHWIAR